MSDLHTYEHDEFEVVRTDNRFGGFEELRHKDQNATVSLIPSTSYVSLKHPTGHTLRSQIPYPR